MIFLKIAEHQQLPVYFQQVYFFHVIVMQSINQGRESKERRRRKQDIERQKVNHTSSFADV
jgi:hypothetical protein